MDPAQSTDTTVESQHDTAEFHALPMSPQLPPKRSRKLVIVAIAVVLVLVILIVLLLTNHEAAAPKPAVIKKAQPRVLSSLTYKDGVSFLNVAEEGSANYLKNKIDTVMDASSSDIALCLSDENEIRTRTKIGTVGGLVFYECDSASQLHCYTDKAETQIMPCPGEGLTQTTYFSLEKSKRDVYQTAVNLDTVIPGSYKQSDTTKHWVITKKVVSTSLDTLINSRRIDSTEFYKFSCIDAIISAEACTASDTNAFIYYRPAWSIRYYFVELLDGAGISHASGKTSG
jgi:hypothetical protein